MTTNRHTDRLVIGTRGSLLALAQTRGVIALLTTAHPDMAIEERIISTRGDREQGRPLPEIGGKGLFTEELERALLDGSIDLAVHSAKDLPTQLQPGLAMVACPKREDPRDAWVSSDGAPFAALPSGSVVGTSSLRRQAQLLMDRPDLTFIALRGNVDTRIAKVHRGDCAGAVLAMAGLRRAGLAHHATHPFEPDVMLPAPGQGALALEGRIDDDRVLDCVAAIDDADTRLAVGCERAVLARLDAGCRAPVGLMAEVAGAAIACRALVASPDGRRVVRAEATGRVDGVEDVVNRIVGELEGGGAAEIIAACRAGRADAAD